MLRERMHYDADPATVYAMLTDRDFQGEAMAATHARDHAVEVEDLSEAGAGSGTGGGEADVAPARRVTTRRTLPTTDAPDVVRRFVGDGVTVTQITTWGHAGPDGSREATSTAEIGGVPVEAAGTMRLEPAGGGTDHVVEVFLTSRVPLIGGRIVSSAEPFVAHALDAEHRAGMRHLARG
ncbi:DUF2505 domain-containing protein [Mobilicoccus sp.]|uniref:DUF2505 domain-containing protein n=1 Tax=Mobilicoccus sp. TaxID=2034349 RepID=UPI0028A7AE23|nr:DUF2505 domain-containing protein [Mobilicoccus sp.]